MDKLRAIIQKILKNNFYAISLYARQIAGTLVLFLIARYLTVYDYGLFTSYKTLSVFILVLANMGYESYILVSSQNNVVKVKQKIALFMLNAITIVALVLLGLPFSFVGVKLLFALVFIRTFLDGTFFALVLPYFQASRKLKIISIINIIYAIAIMGIAILSYLFKLSIIKFLLLNIFLGIINFIQCSIYSKIPYLQILKHLKLSIKLLDKSLLSYMLINICFILYSQIQGVFVSTQVNKELAALYFAANTIACIVMLLIGAQTQKLMPEFIDIKQDLAEKFLKNEVKKMNYITFSILAFFIVAGKFVLTLLYGQKIYANAYFILLILSTANIFYGMGKIYITYIMAKNNTNIILKMQVVSIVISIIVLGITHKYGIYSAALAYFLSAVYIGIAYMQTTKQLLKNNIKETTCNNN